MTNKDILDITFDNIIEKAPIEDFKVLARRCKNDDEFLISLIQFVAILITVSPAMAEMINNHANRINTEAMKLYTKEILDRLKNND